ncbi:MAG: GTPase [Acutalibacteraceae bacterium]|nr:GTPase [Acutalibacteraceae bacterium]
MSNSKMNILVVGNSGVGKSTLINAISGTEAQTGVGESNTQEISIYESNTWPMMLIDTKGFEYNHWEQQKTIKQIKKFTKKNLGNDENTNLGIDAVWFCVDGTSKRISDDHINMMNKAIKGWKNIPIFAVVTKSFSELEIEENKQAVQEAFEKVDKTNLKNVIPVVAKPYAITNEIVVQPRGIDELCLATIECSEEAKSISAENKLRMTLQQKRYNANAIVVGATAAGIVVGAVPIPFADSFILIPIETGLTKSILKIYGVKFSGELISSLVGSTAITNVAKAAISSLKAIPNIASSVINAVVAGFFVAALGEAVIGLAEAICRGVIDVEKIDSVVNYTSEKLKENPMLGFVVEYIENNADELNGKSAKEIYKTIEKALKKAAITGNLKAKNKE